jgi:hypothetical protein
MKALIFLAIILALFGIVGRIDYDAEIAMANARVDMSKISMGERK